MGYQNMQSIAIDVIIYIDLIFIQLTLSNHYKWHTRLASLCYKPIYIELNALLPV